MKRRKFLKYLGMGAGGVALAPGLRGAPALASTSGAGAGGRPRNLIFLVSDGMSQGTLTLADQYRVWRGEEPTEWVRLFNRPGTSRAQMDMASLDSIVTDSAAASSSWGSGHRVPRRSLNVGPDGTAYPTLLEKARQAGKRTGLVCTATATHATPAGFAANLASRYDEAEIARQYLERRVDVVMGGGEEFFMAEKREDGRDLLAEYRAAGYRLVRDKESMEAASRSQEPLLGLFGEGFLPYDLDLRNQPEVAGRVPDLRAMMRAALDVLSGQPEGFVLMVEGARVDHAAHWNDLAGLIFDQLALDQCIGEALAFQREREPDTLIVVASDHGNANPGLSIGTGMGDLPFQFLDGCTGTYERMLEGLDEKATADQWIERIQQFTPVELTDRDRLMIERFAAGEYDPVYRRFRRGVAFLGQLLANHTEVGWVGNTHTSDYVELTLHGPGSEGLPGFIRNDALHHFVVEKLGIGTAGILPA